MRISSNTRNRGPRTALIAVAGLAACATLITGCGSSGSSDSSGSGGGKAEGNITLRIGTFGDFGFDDKTGAKLYSEYHQLHPNVTVVQDNNTDSAKYWDALKLHLGSGSGVDDIQAIEIGNIAEATSTLADKFVDLGKTPGVDPTAWLDYKTKQATTADGTLIGLGTDVGPMAICYRKDLFKAAGLPTDRDAVSALWAGSWDKYLQVGEQFKAKAPAGSYFLDSSGGVFNAVVSSQPQQYSDAQGKLIYQTSPGVKLAWNTAVKSIQQGLSAGLQQFDDGGNWAAAFKNKKFATVSCPSWMTGQVATNTGAEGQGQWDIAKSPVAGNWGGSFLSIPKGGKHQDEAIKLAAWLTAPEQQAKVFAKFGNIPSTKAGLSSPEVVGAKQAFFGDTPTGQIYADIAKSVTPAPIGPWDGQVKDIITKNGLLDIEQHHTDPAKAWSNVESAVKDKTDN